MEKLDILVVEDKKIHQDSANDLLGEHNIVVASNLVEALAHLGQDYVGNRNGIICSKTRNTFNWNSY